jgi:CRP-like cAMP-binding protein
VITPTQEISSDGRANRLLAALPIAEYTRLRSEMALVRARHGDVLTEPGDVITHVYFPTEAVASRLIAHEHGTLAETDVVGADGFIGLPLVLGVDHAATRVLVQVSGLMLRMPTATFRAALRRGDVLLNLLLSYAEVVFIKMAHAIACNQFHTTSARCARRLLETQDRVGVNEFPLTHDFLATMLALRRATVTIAVGSLQKAGLIRYRRGHIRVLDRMGLEAAACECYRTIVDSTNRLLGPDRRNRR